MTALLKKRALAEYSTSQTIVVEPPNKLIKKIKLIKKPSHTPVSIYVGLLDNCKTNNEALQLLIRISDALTVKDDDLPIVIKKLSDHFNQQSESVVRVKILSLFLMIGQVPGIDVEAIMELTLKLVKKDLSHKVIAQGLNTLHALLPHIPENKSLQLKVLSAAKHYLQDTNHWVKRICLKIIGTINASENLSLLSEYIHSQDARVRSAAFTTLVSLHESGQQLHVSLYCDACSALTDDYEIVREAALKMVCLLGNTYPEYPVTVPKTEEDIRLIDDAFAKVCQAINDLSMHVRTQAAQLLGTMTRVSSRFLNQTLDKKLMSNMRRKKSLHERSNDIVASGEWSSGKKWADDAPKELLDKDAVNVLSSGACGAFVHGLEDEFMEVRSASVDAMCSLAICHSEFAFLSLDFLVDMFNDEIEGVRIKAIDCLISISRHVVLRQHQLETILGALEDSSIDVREGLHRMLAACLLATKDCLQMCIENLLDNLKKYPEDKKSTWRCVKEMGSKHAHLTLPLVPQLLNIHPFFLLPEPDVEDPHYITLLILVFNAAKHCSTMLQLFEEHTIKHYSYLRVTLPTLVPHLELSQVKEQESSIGDGLTSGSEFLGSLVGRVASSGQAGARARLAHSIIPHLERIALTDATLSSAARFSATFLQAQLQVRTVLSDNMWCSNAAATTVQGNAIKNNITQILTLALKLEYLFVGLDKAELSVVKQFKLKALALHLVYIVRVSNRSALALCEHFLAQVEHTQRYHVENELGCDEFCRGVFTRMNSLEELKPGAVARCLLPLLSPSTLITTPKPNIQMRMCRAVMNGPVSSADAPIKFTAGLVIATQLDADIFGLRDPSALRIKIHYPDQQTHISVPSLHDLRPSGSENSLEAEYRLLTSALISHTIWTEACYVEITLCLELSEGELTHRTHYSIDPYLELCAPLKLHVAPKPVKRGI